VGKTATMLLVLVFLTASSIATPLSVKAESKTIVVPDDYQTISSAIGKVKVIKNHLLAYKDELQLRLASKEKSSKLDRIEEETQISDAEARRRSAVVESKLWGAVIELLDMQRDELKKRDDLTKQIIELQKEVRNLSVTLSTILTDLGSIRANLK